MNQHIYSVVGQKGGGGKSTTAYALAVVLATNGKKVLIADLDVGQHTSAMWHSIRSIDIKPKFDVIKCKTLEDVGRNANSYDVVVIDCPPHASKLTLEAAECSSRVVIATGPSIADLQPSVILASELKKAGIDADAIKFVICKSTSIGEIVSAVETIIENGFSAASSGIRMSTAYGKAQDRGLSITEASYASLRAEAKACIAELILGDK